MPGAGNQPPAFVGTGGRHGGKPGYPAAGGGWRSAGAAGGPARARCGASRGGGASRVVRVLAAGDRDGGAPAASSSGMVSGRAGGGAGGGEGPAAADGNGERVGGRRFRLVVCGPDGAAAAAVPAAGVV